MNRRPAAGLPQAGTGRRGAGAAATLLVGMALFSSHAARAQVTVTLTPSSQTGAPGTTVNYTATVSNLSSAAVYLNGIAFSIDPSSTQYIAGNDSVFFAKAPSQIAGNSSYSGTLFGVDIRPAAANASSTSFFGTVTLTGGTTDTASDVLGTPQQFIVMLTATTPEPNAGILTAAGILLSGGGAWYRRRRRTISH